jgi:hypothetical protein
MVNMEELAEMCPDALKADGFDEAIIGYCDDIVAGCNRIVYDYRKMVKVLTARDEMTEEEAEEYIDFNVIQAYMGDNTPVYLNKFISEEE